MKSEITIVGAGPYGLALAAHLPKISGLPFRIFGEPMAFWRDFMPKGMYLRSAWRACYIADPQNEFKLEAYQAATGEKISAPVPLEKFVSYGRWFQEQVVPDVDPRQVAWIERKGSGFQLKLRDGSSQETKRVVVATGISSFAWCPPSLRIFLPRRSLTLPNTLISPGFAARASPSLAAGKVR